MKLYFLGIKWPKGWGGWVAGIIAVAVFVGGVIVVLTGGGGPPQGPPGSEERTQCYAACQRDFPDDEAGLRECTLICDRLGG